MKLANETRNIETNVTGEVIKMGFAEGAQAKLQELLSGVYDDPEMALIRELATNGRDSHIAAGNDAPIEVETPSALRPLLIIRDFGVGLDAEDIKLIYSQYGASTKDQSDDEAGMFGIGCKAPLTYTDQFTLVGRKCGIQTTVSIARGTDGGTMTIQNECPTNEPNGVEIQIAAERGNDFANKAAELFRFWEEGTVLVNGKPPERVTGTEVGDSFLIVEDDDMESDYIVQGNVPYPTDIILPGSDDGYGRRRNRYSDHHIVARVPMGTVMPTPSRESLVDNNRNTAALEKAGAEFASLLLASLNKHVEAADDKPDALKRAVEARDQASTYRLRDVTFTYKGEEVPSEIKMPQKPNASGLSRDMNTMLRIGHRLSSPGRQYSSVGARELVSQGDPVCLTNYKPEKMAKPQREKLEVYLAKVTKLSEVPSQVIGVRDLSLPMSDWYKPAAVIDWDDVKKWRDPDAPKIARAGGGKTKGTYPGYVDGCFTEEIDPENSPKVAWRESNKYGLRNHADNMQGLAGDDEHIVLLELASNRVAKFQREFPKCLSLEDWMKARADAWGKTLTADEKKALALEDSELIHELDPEKLPAKWRPHVKLARLRKELQGGEKAQQHNRLRGRVGHILPNVETTEQAMMDALPLLSLLGSSYRYHDLSPDALAHIHTYINAVETKE